MSKRSDSERASDETRERARRPRRKRLGGALALCALATLGAAGCGDVDGTALVEPGEPATMDAVESEPAAAPVSEGEGDAGGGMGLVLERSHWSSPHALDLGSSVPERAEVELELVGGAEFEGGETRVARVLEGGSALELPPVRLVEAPMAALRVRVDGRVAMEDISIVGVPEGSLDELAAWRDAGGSMSFGAHDALLDAAAFEQALGECEDVVGAAVGDGELGRAEQALSFPRLCIRTPFGPGKVKWENNSGFQVLPEGGGGRRPLSSASPNGSTQNVDALWHRNFGCSFLKVPDHCTVTVDGPGDIDCCCNAATSIVAGRCRFTGPAEVGGRPAPGCG